MILLVLLYEGVRVLHARNVVVVRFKEPITQGTQIIKAISSERRRRLLQVQDPSFYHHKGYDFKTPGAGVTTITQALVKKLFFENFRPGWRKIDQTLIARYAVTPKISKEDQLAAFVAVGYFGHCQNAPVTGFAEAARCYYGKDLATLSDDEFIGLLAMLVGPNHYHPIKHPERHLNRVRRIKRFLSLECVPLDNSDIYYEACADEAGFALGR